MSLLKEINVAEIKDFNIGHSVNEAGMTGVTALYFPEGAYVGIDISGGGPASRETPLATPLTANNPVNAILLSGGSAYGLAASDGAMRCLEEAKIGYETGFAKIPLVCQSCIYDLGVGDPAIRPDATLGYEAMKNAISHTDPSFGNVGAGLGATVGKLHGMDTSCKSGLGLKAFQIEDIYMVALVVVNALGDIYNPLDGKRLAGLLDNDKKTPLDTVEEMYKMLLPRDMFTGNTTIGAIITNAKFDKASLNKIASMTRNAYARCIRPVGTMADGDTIYVASVGDKSLDINVAGAMAAKTMEAAITSIFN